MKTTTKTVLATLMLLAISCTKENSSIQSSRITGESSTQAVVTGMNEPGEYASIKLGSYAVMKKNLNVSRYRNGDMIPQVNDPAKWATLTTGAWCWYNNDSANGAVYGKLYNWYAVNDPRGLAPAGWHIPSDSECTALTALLGGNAVAGGKMKSTGTIEDGTGLWLAPNYGATNSSGFTGLHGGERNINVRFTNIGWEGFWWCSSEYNTTTAWFRGLNYGGAYVDRGTLNKRNGLSVRCVKD